MNPTHKYLSAKTHLVRAGTPMERRVNTEFSVRLIETKGARSRIEHWDGRKAWVDNQYLFPINPNRK